MGPADEINRLRDLLARAEAQAQARERVAFEAGFNAYRTWPDGWWHFDPPTPDDIDEMPDQYSAYDAWKAWQEHVTAEGIRQLTAAGIESP